MIKSSSFILQLTIASLGFISWFYLATNNLKLAILLFFIIWANNIYQKYD